MEGKYIVVSIKGNSLTNLRSWSHTPSLLVRYYITNLIQKENVALFFIQNSGLNLEYNWEMIVSRFLTYIVIISVRP